MNFEKQIPKQVEITEGVIGGVSSHQSCYVKKCCLYQKENATQFFSSEYVRTPTLENGKIGKLFEKT